MTDFLILFLCNYISLVYLSEYQGDDINIINTAQLIFKIIIKLRLLIFFEKNIMC